jgi:dTDP-4-dehydrorhamnose reductase
MSQDQQPNVLIVGALGQVGNEFRFLSFTTPQFRFMFVDRDELDITKPRQVEKFFERHAIQYCVNCAAYTAVDKAESEKNVATKVNAHAVKYLAQACEKHGAVLIQISTDYVYHSNHNQPFKEDQRPAPKSVYAKTKLQGDRHALKYCSRSIVLRTSWVYSTFGHNFVKTMLRLGKERPSLNIVFDQIGTPTYARDLAKAIIHILRKINAQEVSRDAFHGIFHYSNEGVTSWFDFAQAIFDIRSISCETHPIETVAYPTPAKRPPFSVLNKQKIRDTFGLKIPHWRDSLVECLGEL